MLEEKKSQMLKQNSLFYLIRPDNFSGIRGYFRNVFVYEQTIQNHYGTLKNIPEY